MPSLKEIRNRITSVKKTQKTTSAMKMVSAAKLNRAEDTIRRARPYAAKLRTVVSSLSGKLTPDDNRLFRDQDGKRVAVVLMTSDRGLCGGFNATSANYWREHSMKKEWIAQKCISWDERGETFPSYKPPNCC